MIYVFYSLSQKSFLKREAKKVTKASLGEVNEFNYASFDAKETPLREIINACLEVPMLENKKVVVVDDADFLSGAKSKDKINTEKDFDIFEKYINNPTNETDLILIVYADKLDARSKLTKLLNEKAKVAGIAPLKPNDWEKYTAQLIEKKQLHFDMLAIHELAKRTLNDRDRLLNELTKLSLYKPNDEIKLNDIVTLVSEPLEDKAFQLTNDLLEGNTSGALTTYHDLLKQKGTEPITLLLMLANQFRLMYVVNYLHEHDQAITEIATSLHQNEFRIKKVYQSSKKFKNKLIDILDEIYSIDFKIKSGQADHSLLTELFIINFKNKYC